METEQRAAQKIGQDIVKYVEKMEAMEMEIENLKKGKKKKTQNRSSTTVEMLGDTLTAVTEESHPIQGGN